MPLGSPSGDPLRGDDGYPHDIELQRISTWPATTMADLRALMDYVKERWSYPRFWEEEVIEEYGRPIRQYTISTGGWSGNESLIAALEANTMWSIIAPWSWRRGGHFVYRIPEEEPPSGQS